MEVCDLRVFGVELKVRDSKGPDIQTGSIHLTNWVYSRPLQVLMIRALSLSHPVPGPGSFRFKTKNLWNRAGAA